MPSSQENLYDHNNPAPRGNSREQPAVHLRALDIAGRSVQVESRGLDMTPAYLAVETVEFCNDLCDELYWTLDEAWKVQDWDIL